MHWAARAYAELSDESLHRKYEAEVRYHDHLIDSAPMGDDRIYFVGRAIDVMRAEIKRRAAKAGAPDNG